MKLSVLVYSVRSFDLYIYGPALPPVCPPFSWENVESC